MNFENMKKSVIPNKLLESVDKKCHCLVNNQGTMQCMFPTKMELLFLFFFSVFTEKWRSECGISFFC